MKKILSTISSIVLVLAVAVSLLPQSVNAASYPTSITNSSLETELNTATPLGWSRGNWGNNTATFTYPVAGQDGARGAQVSISSYVDGDAKWYFDPISINPGTQYDFKDWYKSNVSTDAVAQFNLAGGGYSYLYLGSLPPATSWTNSTLKFTAPANAEAVTVFHLLNKVGNLQIDNFSIVPSVVVPPFQFDSGILPNGSVENTVGNPERPANWNQGSWGSNKSTFSYLKTGRTGSKSLKLTVSNYVDGDAKWFADTQPAVPNQSYDYTDYYQANTNSEVYAAIGLTDGSTVYQYLGGASASTSWKQFKAQFTVPATAATITMFHLLNKNGYLITDDHKLSPFTPIGFNSPIVSITFDDGWSDQYTNANPILKQYNMPATFYLVASFLNTPDYMTATQAKSLRSTGNELASHSYTHANLTTLGTTALNRETSTAKTKLVQLVGAPIDNFASPYGAYNDNVITKLKSVYNSHRTVTPGYNSKYSFDKYAIKVQNITDKTTEAEVSSWVNYAKQNNLWLVLVYHQISNDNLGDYSATPYQLASHLQIISNSGVQVKTVSGALATIAPQLP